MSATAASVAQASPSARTPSREPWPARLLKAGVVAALAVLVLGGWPTVANAVSTEWMHLLFWTSLVFVVNLFPIAVGDTRLTLDEPTLLAVCFLYPPPVAALVAAVGAADLREFKREVASSRALFNRAQIGLSVYLAGLSFRFVAGQWEPWHLAIVATAVAVAVDFACNAFLVALYVGSRRGESPARAAKGLTVGSARQFLGTYFGYGAYALILARLFVEVGPWSVVGFLVPILVARQMLVRGQRLEELADRLKRRERFLERLVERIVDERRDERLRIAGDLHDDVLQALTRIWFLARILERKLAVVTPEGSSLEEVGELVQGSELSVESLRNVIHDLKRSPLGRGGLIPTLNLLVRDLQLDWKTRIELRAPVNVELSASNQVLAYQILREGILNALKHAKATRVTVNVSSALGRVMLEVGDDGIGFDVQQVDSESHFGLGLIRERVQKAGGSLQLESRQAHGTRLLAKLPKEPLSQQDLGSASP